MTTVAADAAVLAPTVGANGIFLVVFDQLAELPLAAPGAQIGQIRDLDMDGLPKAVAAQMERAA